MIYPGTDITEALLAGDKHCRVCGALITGAPFARSGDEYCCEGCYLKSKQCRIVETGKDDPYLILTEALVAALDAREHETGLHSKRVACHTLVLARRFTGDSEHLRQVYWGSLLHDLGKIGIPDAILLKAGPLTEPEWQVMRKHPEIGQHILSAVSFLAEASEIVLNHEERFDGQGYPRGLVGDEIPLWARLFAVIDTLDAITSDRAYRQGHSFDTAKEEILHQSGIQFDPLAIEAFIAEESELRQMVDLKCGRAPIP